MYLVVEITVNPRKLVLGTVKYIRNSQGWGLKECKLFYEGLFKGVIPIDGRLYPKFALTFEQHARFLDNAEFEDTGDIVDFKIIEVRHEEPLPILDVRGLG